ncbi:hypothetical protein ACFQFC_37235 [Amorphoplanes digitatis]|uniref:Uncharacterized protein n=1 Tax=Actinoplanes digitatis TaxID=1868 RepID=A0A7W7HW44_9ACTN|nr:hypothetical protein [Actinoplanes digitatis]MBB4761804.1 hypothetical protein [Actinoplanes digitatis]BFE70456.1 hypothetical protein GCM10020092_037570 [Actinoplanes digitatis]GID90915.1 hypothetical protein Adi01nite_03270 [Actinoplanes digitatis]
MRALFEGVDGLRQLAVRGRRLFTPTEVALCILIVAAGITGVVGLWTGFIAI